MVGAISAPSFLLPPISRLNPKISFIERNPLQFYQIPPKFGSPLLTFPIQKKKSWISLTPKASVGSTECAVEPTTGVKFQTSLRLPGCSDSLTLLGTGYREKVFAIIGVKVYAVGLYINQSIIAKLTSWKGRSLGQIQEDSTLFRSLFQAPSDKSLQIVLVRDVDGKTFWDALDDAISPRIKAPVPVDESALSTFRNTFQSRALKQGTFIFLTWVEPSKMLVSISSNGLPSMVDSTIESVNVASALYDVFFGDSPVSPTLKASVANGLAMLLM